MQSTEVVAYKQRLKTYENYQEYNIYKEHIAYLEQFPYKMFKSRNILYYKAKCLCVCTFAPSWP